MNKVDVTFIFQNGKYQNYARTNQNGTYSNEIYSIDSLMAFLSENVSKGVFKKGRKIDYGKGNRVVYSFKYKNNDINCEKKSGETIRIEIPDESRELYELQEKQLDSLVNINCKLRKATLMKVAAISAAGVVLVTFATIMAAKGLNEIAKEIYEEDHSRAKSYVDSIKQEPTYPEWAKQESYIRDLEERAKAGDSEAEFEYNRYLASQAAESSSKIK